MKRELSFSVALLSALLVCSCKSQSTPSLEFDGKVLEAPLLSDELTDKPVSLDDLRSIESIWKYIGSPLANVFTILLWSTFNYLLSRILYIIRTPRI